MTPSQSHQAGQRTPVCQSRGLEACSRSGLSANSGEGVRLHIEPHRHAQRLSLSGVMHGRKDVADSVRLLRAHFADVARHGREHITPGVPVTSSLPGTTKKP